MNPHEKWLLSQLLKSLVRDNMINFILRGNMKKGYIEIRGLIIRGLIIRGGVALVVCGSSREKNPHPSRPCINTCHIRLFAVRDKVLRSLTQPSPPVQEYAPGFFPPPGAIATQAISPIRRSACNG
jgi:hypothetical protein